MSEKSVKVTVLIPTRERAETLIHCLKTVTSQNYPNIEILVSDNFSGPEVKAVVDEAVKQDARVRYVRTPERLGMSEHWNWAVEHITGDWVTILGDDDGLLPNAVEKFLKVHNENPEIEAITTVNCFYRWPIDGAGEKLFFMGGKGYEVRDCKEYMKKALLGLPISQPTIYTGGFVSMKLFNRIKEKSPDKHFFQSIIPDYYSGMAICSVADKYIYSWEPWFVAGSSKHSNGRQHNELTQDQMKNLNFHTESKMKFLPSLGDGCVKSSQILLYESYLKSSHLRNYSIEGISLEQQMILAILNCSRKVKPAVTGYCEDIAEINDVDFQKVLGEANKRKLVKRIKKLSRKFFKNILGFSKSKSKVLRGVKAHNVYEASKRIDEKINLNCA